MEVSILEILVIKEGIYRFLENKKKSTKRSRLQKDITLELD